MTKREIIPDLLCLAGGASILYGCWLVYPPLTYLIGGAFLIALGVWIQRRQK